MTTIDFFTEAPEVRFDNQELELTREVVLGIGRKLVRLATAMDYQDLDGLNVTANRLDDIFSKYGAHEITAKVIELELLIVADKDMLAILHSANQLLNVCRATQDAFLETVISRSVNRVQ